MDDNARPNRSRAVTPTSKANTKVYTYGSDNTLQLMGKFYATFESSDKIVTAPVFVVKRE
jgi:hypothetical protein